MGDKETNAVFGTNAPFRLCEQRVLRLLPCKALCTVPGTAASGPPLEGLLMLSVVWPEIGGRQESQQGKNTAAAACPEAGARQSAVWQLDSQRMARAHSRLKEKGKVHALLPGNSRMLPGI